MNNTRLVEQESFPVIVVFVFTVKTETKTPVKHHASNNASSPPVACLCVKIVQ